MQGMRLGVLAKVLPEDVLQGRSHDALDPYCLETEIITGMG
jgi:hypothetical protein